MSFSSDPLSANLLKELGDDLGLPLIFDEQGQCLLVLDDNLMISIQQREDSWILYGMLGEFWQPDMDFFYSLFSLNIKLIEQGQGTVIFRKNNNALLYLQSISLKNADKISLYHSLENFSDWLGTLMHDLNESSAGQARVQGPMFAPPTHFVMQQPKEKS